MRIKKQLVNSAQILLRGRASHVSFLVLDAPCPPGSQQRRPQ